MSRNEDRRKAEKARRSALKALRRAQNEVAAASAQQRQRLECMEYDARLDDSDAGYVPLSRVSRRLLRMAGIKTTSRGIWMDPDDAD